MNEYRKERLIQIARSLQTERTGRSLHFSFLLRNNQLLVTATNSYTKSHPIQMFGEYYPTKENTKKESYVPALHSEISGIRSFLNKFGHTDFKKITLFNVRIGPKGDVMMAKPCLNCQRVLNSFNFDKIIWTE